MAGSLITNRYGYAVHMLRLCTGLPVMLCAHAVRQQAAVLARALAGECTVAALLFVHKSLNQLQDRAAAVTVLQH